MSSDDLASFVAHEGDERLTAAILSDSCDAAGLRDQVLAERLAPVVPGLRAFGRARTVRFVPSSDDDPDDPYGDAIALIDGLAPGDVVVIATDRSNDSAFWGELFSAAAMGRDVAGVVTDGNLRDVERIAALGFAAFGRSHRPIDFRRRMKISDVDEPVDVGGVRIAAGDIVLADDDGVVVVPHEHAAQVLALARERAARESTVLAELLAGESLRTVWDRHRVL